MRCKTRQLRVVSGHYRNAQPRSNNPGGRVKVRTYLRNIEVAVDDDDGGGGKYQRLAGRNKKLVEENERLKSKRARARALRLFIYILLLLLQNSSIFCGPNSDRPVGVSGTWRTESDWNSTRSMRSPTADPSRANGSRSIQTG